MNWSSGSRVMLNEVYGITSRIRVGVNRGKGWVGLNLWQGRVKHGM